MQLIKQLLKLKIEKYFEHSANGRYFFSDFYEAHTLASVVLGLPVDKQINKLMRAYYWKILQDMLSNENISDIDDIDSDGWEKVRLDYLKKRQSAFFQIKDRVTSDMAVINAFFDKYRSVKSRNEYIAAEGRGVLAISSWEVI